MNSLKSTVDLYTGTFLHLLGGYSYCYKLCTRYIVRTSACKVWISLPFTLEEMQPRTQRPYSESTCSTLDNGVCRTLKTISTPTKQGRITTWFELSFLLCSFLLSKLCPDNNMRSSLLELMCLMFLWRWFM